MPFSHAKDFEQDVLLDMRKVFEEVSAALSLKDGDPQTSKLANVIMALALKGERDFATVRAKALEQMK